jgi:hypothetical protein
MPQTLSGSRSASVEIYLILLFLPYKKDGFLAQGLQRAVPGKPVRKLWQRGQQPLARMAFASERRTGVMTILHLRSSQPCSIMSREFEKLRSYFE